MPEPTATAAAVSTIGTASMAVPVITVLGVSVGMRPDLLVAGFGGALVAIVLLNAVPGEGDTWRALVRTSLRRMAVAMSSSLTAAYVTPLALLLANVPEPLMLSMAFVVGAFAQPVLVSIAGRLWPLPAPAEAPGGPPP